MEWVTLRPISEGANKTRSTAETEGDFMADPNDKVPGQAPGRYYVDADCIDCDVCRETAPNNFMANEDEGFSFLFKQPENDDEEDQCQEALRSCPVEAIGDDGDRA
jgi:ferredoxin